MPSPWKWCVFAIIFVCQTSAHLHPGCPPQDAILPCRCLARGEEFQVWCSHSDLPRVLEGLKSLAQFISKPIDELILENNNLPSLPGRAFAPLKVMRLMMRYNSLERVSSGWLSGLEDSLMELFLVEPELKSLPADSLDRFRVLEAVTLQAAQIKRLPAFSALPRLRYLQIDSASLTELPPRIFRNLPALEKLQIHGSQRLARLEGGFLTDLPTLSLVNISFCGIAWMHPRAFSQLPLLKELWLVGNKISDAGMVGRSSKDLPKLQVLRLDRNSLNRLGEAAFVDLPALRRLHLSRNEIREIHHGAFHRVPMLRTLDLNHNLVKRVHPESFLQHSGSGLEELSLIDNDISHIAELRSLLETLPRLVFLDLSHNNLVGIPFGALRGHSTLERLHLDYNKLEMIDREAFMAMPALRELRLKNNSLSERLAAPLWNLPSLKGLDLSGNFYRRINPGLLQNLPSLRRIDLSGNELISVDPEAFLATPDLEHVNLSRNSLTELHPATFGSLIGLYELDVSANRLVEFIPGLPRGIEYLHLSQNRIANLPALSPDLNLPALRMLNINDNAINSVSPGVFRSLPQLRRLYLGKNALELVDQSFFDGLTRLEVLHIAENRISDIHPLALKEMPELREFHVNRNRLSLLRPELFQHTPRLRKLNISRNHIKEIHPGTLERTRDLEVIDASHNVLLQLPLGLNELKKLKVLHVANNRLQGMLPDTLASLASLNELKMSGNFIRELRAGAFSRLLQLKSLRLDNNQLETIGVNSFRSLPSLKTLDLSKNKLQVIETSAFNDLPSLQVLELQENAVRSVASAAFRAVPHLLVLNLSVNALSSLDAAGLKGLGSLEMLDVSNNRLTRFSGGGIEKMEWLVEVKADNNGICAIQGPIFSHMPRLRVLSIRNNKLMSFPEEAVAKIRSNLALLDLEGNPLSCSCNLVWMQSWLQESSAVGPRCADGSLLREMRLPRQDCRQEEQLTELVAPDCEAELLSAPGTSQLIQKWMALKENSTKLSFGHKNNLAPLPEESDYFYNDYVDYPYNDTTILAEPVKIEQKIVSTTKKPQNSSHYISGDTPTIYAASRNKTRSPPKVPDSPSSSGFTFFGVPLPSLSLNNLWGGNGRMEDPPLKAVTADRKSAIVNEPKLRPPEFETGGFKPILPGTGGFKPIAHPLYFTAFNHSQSNKRNDTQVASSKNRVHVNAPVLPPTTSANRYLPAPTLPSVVSTTTKVIIIKNYTSTTPVPPVKENATLPDIEISEDAVRFEDLFAEEVVVNVSTTTTTQRIIISSTTEETTTTTREQLPKEILATPLTGFLVPGGQQPPFRPAGRPTITKVRTPQETTPAAPLQSALELPILPLPHGREVQKAFEATPIQISGNDHSWYFANYNKTNLEPYYGTTKADVQIASSTTVQIEMHKIVFMIPIVIFNVV